MARRKRLLRVLPVVVQRKGRMHMNHRLLRLAARFLAVGLLAATLSMVDSLTFPDTAEARCAGNGNPVNSTMSYGGVVRVSDDPVTGTCNENQLYTAVLKDRRADGNCVEVFFGETVPGGIRWLRAAYTCGPDVRFEYRDINDNSRAYQTFCIYDRDTFATVACGWGNSTSLTLGQYYGTNYGY
jgi:hypothetical protein